MHCLRLIHWDAEAGLHRQRQLSALGYDVAFDPVDGASVLRKVRGASTPVAFVIDLSRLPSYGREVGRVLRTARASRHVPLVFVDGDPVKVALTRALLPDATYTTWGRLSRALARVVARPPSSPVVPREVMTAKPAVAKLGIKAGQRVGLLGAPLGFSATLKPLPPDVTFTARPEHSCDLVLCFVRSARELSARAVMLRDQVDRQTLWLIWPKKASGVRSDLDANAVRHAGLAHGWVDFKVCAVDATWSGLAFKRRR